MNPLRRILLVKKSRTFDRLIGANRDMKVTVTKYQEDPFSQNYHSQVNTPSGHKFRGGEEDEVSK